MLFNVSHQSIWFPTESWSKPGWLCKQLKSMTNNLSLMHVPPPPSCRWLTDRVCYWLLGSLQKVSYDIKSLTKVETRATSYRRFNGWLPRVFFVWFAHPWSLTDVRWEEICWILRLWLNTKVCKGLRLSHEQRISMPCPFYVLVLIRYGRRIYWFFFLNIKNMITETGGEKNPG